MPWLVLLLALGGELGNDDTAGVRLSARVGGGVVENDVVGIVDVGVGFDSAPASLHLRVPLTLRLLDQAPLVDDTLPPLCRRLRCEEVLRGDRLDPTALARVIDEVRLFQPGDVVHARAGRLVATLGAGAVVDRLTTVASWDRRTSGAWGAVRLPVFGIAVDAFVADVVSPLELLALRAEAVPLSFVPIVVGVDVGADLSAPVDVVDSAGDVRDGARTRPVIASAVDARVPIGLGAFAFAPRLEFGLTSGLAENGRDPGVGVGGAGGVDVGFDGGFVAVQARGMFGVGSGGYRRGVFSMLHLVERRRALLGSIVDRGGLVHVPAPGGVGGDLRLQASILDAVAPLLRLHLEPAPGANAIELGIATAIADVSVSASVIRRGFVDVGGIVDGNVGARPLLLVLEGGWRFWGPLSASVRWFRLPRFAGGAVTFDNDVLVSLSADGVLVKR